MYAAPPLSTIIYFSSMDMTVTLMTDHLKNEVPRHPKLCTEIRRLKK